MKGFGKRKASKVTMKLHRNKHRLQPKKKMVFN